MNEADRTYAGWIIIGIIIGSGKTKPNGQPVTFPLYSRVGEMLPIFATKTALLAYCRERGIKLKGSSMNLRPARVRVECKLEEPRP